MRQSKTLTGLAAAAVLAVSASAVSADPVEIRGSYAIAPAHMTPMIPAGPKSVYKHYGKSYTVKAVRMRGSGPALTALAADEVDIAGLSAQALVLGSKRAKLDLVVVGQQMSSNVPGYATSEFWALSSIKSLKDLKGKRIGVNARGSTIDAAVQTQLAKIGFKVDRDYKEVEVRFPAQLAALTSKRIDLGIMVQPFNFMAAKKKGIHKLFTMGDALGPTETIVWIAKRDFVKQHRAALVDMLEDNMRLRKWMYDPKTRDDAIQMLAKLTKRPAKNYAHWAFTHKDNYRDPHCLVNVERYQKNINDLVKSGTLPYGLDVSKKVDMSMAKEAADRLGSM